MEETTTQINFTELRSFHLELFRQMFGESDSLDDVFNIIWKSRLRDELVLELMKRESKYFAK